MCGWYYHANVLGAAYGMIVSLKGVANTAMLGTDFGAGEGIVKAWSNLANWSGPVITMTVGTWYFWALSVSGGVVTAYMVPQGTAVTGSTPQTCPTNIGETSTQTTLLSDAGLYPMPGYVARVRAWSSVLTTAALDSERVSATAVTAGVLFDAPLDGLGNLGGYAIVGTLAAGP
jgi:hypothetical protein